MALSDEHRWETDVGFSGHCSICWQPSVLSCVVRYTNRVVKCCRSVKLSGGFGVKRELDGSLHKSVCLYIFESASAPKQIVKF